MRRLDDNGSYINLQLGNFVACSVSWEHTTNALNLYLHYIALAPLLTGHGSPQKLPQDGSPYGLVDAKTQQLLTKTTPPIESIATQTIATIAFGAPATLISVSTIWQGRRA